MEKDESMASFFKKISQIRDQLVVISVTVDDDDLVQTVVDGLPPSWETFLGVVNAREILKGCGKIVYRKKEESKA
jgi:hypothetical protein